MTRHQTNGAKPCDHCGQLWAWTDFALRDLARGHWLAGHLCGACAIGRERTCVICGTPATASLELARAPGPHRPSSEHPFCNEHAAAVRVLVSAWVELQRRALSPTNDGPADQPEGA